MADAQDTIMFQGEIVGQFAVEQSVAVAFDATARTLTRPSGSFITDGFVAGQALIAPDAATNKTKNFLITEVAALVITVDAPPVTAAETTVTLQAFNPVGNITSRTGPSSTNPRVDVSHSQSDAREYKPGLQDNGSVSFDGNLVRDDPGLIALKTLRNSRGTDTFLIAHGDRLGWERFLASVETFEPTGSLDGAVTFSAALSVSGAITDSELLS